MNPYFVSMQILLLVNVNIKWKTQIKGAVQRTWAINRSVARLLGKCSE